MQQKTSPDSRRGLSYFQRLHCLYFLDYILIALNEIGVLTLTVGADFCVLQGFVSFSAIFAVGNGFDFLDLHLGISKILGLFPCPIPEVNDVLGNYAGNLADLQGDGGNNGKIVLLNQLFHFVYYVIYCSKLMHGFFLRGYKR